MKVETVLALDVGEKRIGLAIGDSDVKIAVPSGIIENNQQVTDKIEQIIYSKKIDKIVVGLPRNSKGEETKQSAYTRSFAEKLKQFDLPVIFQDESLTSVEAEESLHNLQRCKNYNKTAKTTKTALDDAAAALILSDFLETNYGRS
jgi:putative Holliday junction resolvase